MDTSTRNMIASPRSIRRRRISRPHHDGLIAAMIFRNAQAISQTPTPSFPISDLPIEIRMLIFQICVSRQENFGKAPPLIEALRGNPQLYGEVVEVYYATNDFSVSFENQSRLHLNADSVLKRIISLRLSYGSMLTKNAWGFEYMISFPINRLSECSNVRNLYLTTKSTDIRGSNGVGQTPKLVGECILRLPALKTLILEVPTKTVQRIRNPDRDSDIRTILAHVEPTASIDRATGIPHQVYKPERRNLLAMKWDAGRGRIITWTDNVYFRNVRWATIGIIYNLYVVLTGWHLSDFWEEHGLHFLGLNPRQLIIACRWKDCNCKRVIPIRSSWIDPEGYLALAPSGVGIGLRSPGDVKPGESYQDSTITKEGTPMEKADRDIDLVAGRPI